MNCAAYNSDGKILATGGDDKTVRLWDVAAGVERATLKGFANPLLCVRFSPDGKTLATACRSEKGVTLWTLSGKTILTGHTQEVTDLAFAPEGRRLATAAGSDKAGEVKLWDVGGTRESGSGQEIATLPRQPHRVQSLAFSPDGRTLAVASGKEVTLWDPPTGAELKRWQLASPVYRIVYAPGGTTLAVGLENGTVTLHEAASGRVLATLEGQSGTLCGLAFSPDGQMLAAAVKEGPLKVWQLPVQGVLTQAPSASAGTDTSRR